LGATTSDIVMATPRHRPGRRDALRHIALGGAGAACAVGLGGLWIRAARQGAFSDDAARPGFTLIRHQLGWSKGVQFGGEYVALAHGLFEKERLDVRFTSGGPGTSFRTLVASGRALVSESTALGMIEGHIQGQPLVAFGAIMQRDPGCLISAAGNPITSLRDLAGRTIGAPNNIRGQIVALMRQAGLNPDNVRFVPVGTDQSMLIAGQIDATYAWATTSLPSLALAGFRAHVLHMTDIGVPGYGGVLIARRDRVERDFDDFVRYTRALIGGWRYMVAQPVRTAEAIVRNWAPPGASMAEQVLQAKMMVPYIAPDGGGDHRLLWIEPAIFEANVRLMRDAGAIPPHARIDVSKIVTQDVIRAAHASV